MHIHSLPPMLQPLAPREPPAPPPPSRTAVALTRLEDIQALWRDGKRRQKRPEADAGDGSTAEDGEAPAPPGRVDITA